MLAALVEARMDKQLTEALKECVLQDDGGTITVAFIDHDTKWYSHYEDVAMHEALLDFFGGKADAILTDDANEDAAIEGQFVRIGEEDEDIETRTFGEGFDVWGRLSVERSICRDLGTFDRTKDMRGATHGST